MWTYVLFNHKITRLLVVHAWCHLKFSTEYFFNRKIYACSCVVILDCIEDERNSRVESGKVWSLTILLSRSRGQRPNFIMHTAPDCLFLFFAVALVPLFDGLIMTGVMDCYLTGGNWRQYSERSVHFQFILPQKDYIVAFGVYFDINGYLKFCSWPLLSQLDPINCPSLAKISKELKAFKHYLVKYFFKHSAYEIQTLHGSFSIFFT